jgi:hypothetical protein
MIVRTYLSNISRRWPIEKQRALLGKRTPEYLDDLRPAALKRRNAKDLKERAQLLRPTSRTDGEIIEVASFQVLAWSHKDFCEVIAAASARRATLRALDTGHEVAPHPAAEAVAREVQEFIRIVQARGLGRSPAEIAEERRADTVRRIGLIAADWPKPSAEVSTKALLERAGIKPGKPMAAATARRLLGPRDEAQRTYAIKAAQAAGRAAGATSGRKPKL